MKKLQLAHSEQVLRQASIPDIRVIDVSSPTKNRKHLDPDKVEPKVPEVNGSVQGTHHMSLPTSHVELKSHCHPLKTSQSECSTQHAPTIAEQGKHVYHSEPANLNGFVAVLSHIVTFDLLSLYYGWLKLFSFAFRYGKKTNNSKTITGVCAIMWKLLSLHGKKTFYLVGTLKACGYNEQIHVIFRFI